MKSTTDQQRCAFCTNVIGKPVSPAGQRIGCSPTKPVPIIDEIGTTLYCSTCANMKFVQMTHSGGPLQVAIVVTLPATPKPTPRRELNERQRRHLVALAQIADHGERFRYAHWRMHNSTRGSLEVRGLIKYVAAVSSYVVTAAGRAEAAR